MMNRLIAVPVLTLSFLATSAGAGDIFVDEFDDPSLVQWNITTSTDGTVNVTSGRLHVDAADQNDQGIGTFGLITSSSFTRNPAGEGVIYVYFWELEHGKDDAMHYYIGVTEDATLPMSDNDFDFAAFARSSSEDIQEVVIFTNTGSAANIELRDGPLDQPFTGEFMDYRIVIQDQSVDDNTTVMNLEYKMSTEGTWNDFLSTEDPSTRLQFPLTNTPLYVAIAPREQALPDGTDFFLEAVQVTTRSLTAFGLETITVVPSTEALETDVFSATIQSVAGVTYILESTPDPAATDFSATPLVLIGTGGPLTFSETSASSPQNVFRVVLP